MHVNTIVKVMMITWGLTSCASETQQAVKQLPISQLCGMNKKAIELAKLIINDLEQKRQRLVCNTLLAKIAHQKAQEMAKRGRVSHVGSSFANRRLIDAGYPLSASYPRMFENNVEAIAGGISEPEKMWVSFKNSSGHRMHLLAEHEFYTLQDEIGVGFYFDRKSPHQEYWVVYIAHQVENKKFRGQVAKSKD